jgi:type IV pilus assembly protein PilV
MNGGWLPMLGGHLVTRKLQNARVKKPPAPLSFVGPRRSARTQSAGFTLIEVMVALIVLVLGVLGAAAMTMTALRDAKQSSLRAQAVSLAYELGDLMRSSRDQETVFTLNSPAQVPTCWTGGCTPTEMAKNNFFEWKAKLTGLGDTSLQNGGLPNAAYVVCRDALHLTSDVTGFGGSCDGLPTSPLVIKLRWDEKNNNASGAVGATAITKAYLVVLVQAY